MKLGRRDLLRSAVVAGVGAMVSTSAGIARADSGMPANMDMGGDGNQPEDQDGKIVHAVLFDNPTGTNGWGVALTQTTFRVGIKYQLDVLNMGSRAHECMVTTKAASAAMLAQMTKKMDEAPMNDNVPGVVISVGEDKLPKNGSRFTESLIFIKPGDYDFGCYMMVMPGEISGTQTMTTHYALGMHQPVKVV